MCEVDILINDYSATTTDFALLKKPQIFLMPDYLKFEKERGFTDNYKEIMPGKEIHNYEDMVMLISKYLKNSSAYNLEFNNKIDVYLSKYYDSTIHNSCKLFNTFINEKMIN